MSKNWIVLFRDRFFSWKYDFCCCSSHNLWKIYYYIIFFSNTPSFAHLRKKVFKICLTFLQIRLRIKTPNFELIYRLPMNSLKKMSRSTKRVLSRIQKYGLSRSFIKSIAYIILKLAPILRYNFNQNFANCLKWANLMRWKMTWMMILI